MTSGEDGGYVVTRSRPYLMYSWLTGQPVNY
jgi:hypothetical protein